MNVLERSVKRPKRKIHSTPRLLMGDAYTIGSNDFESPEAQAKSIYYITFRKLLPSINPKLYKGSDTRIVFAGLSRIVDYLFYEPVTHEEIDETIRYVEHLKVTTTGLKNYTFPEEIWRRVVDEFNGRPPILIKAVREGSVIYPNEPAVIIESLVDGMGVLAAWFESKLLQVWASTEMLTQLEHWLLYCKTMVKKVYPKPDAGETMEAYNTKIDFLARLMVHNFGDRAGICPQESEWLGETALYTFSGTDTLSGAFQAWKNAGEKAGTSVTVKALAHRNVQSWEKQIESFRALYDSMEDGDIGSFVADCYDFWTAVEGNGKGDDGSLLALALESKRTGNGKIVVARPDSGIAVEQVTWLCRLAEKHGLVEYKEIHGKRWKFATYLKFIEGDGMTWEEMEAINDALLLQGFAPFSWGLYGVGGGLRNGLKRDNTSAKYALCAVGKNLRPVVKFSETLGKTTLPGPFKLLRSAEALEAKKTICFPHEDGVDVFVPYFDGSDIWDPFKTGFDDDFWTIKARIAEQMNTMPESLSTEDNHNYPASDEVRAMRIKLLNEYAPKRLAQNY
jgi:nicotinamide phosphoribosyltransferase